MQELFNKKMFKNNRNQTGETEFRKNKYFTEEVSWFLIKFSIFFFTLFLKKISHFTIYFKIKIN